MLWQVLLAAVVSLALLGLVIVLVLKRAPLIVVADKLPGNLYGGADEVSDFYDGEIEGETSDGDPTGGAGRDGGGSA